LRSNAGGQRSSVAWFSDVDDDIIFIKFNWQLNIREIVPARRVKGVFGVSPSFLAPEKLAAAQAGTALAVYVFLPFGGSLNL
jgi:hypothetical protein